MSTTRFSVTMAMSLALVACVTSPPAPQEHYYRLQPGAESMIEGSELPISIDIERVTADGLLRERALLYSDDDGHRVLKQHAYHYWADTPARLLRDYWSARLDQSRALPSRWNAVTAQYALQFRLRRMERLLGDEGVEVALGLEFVVRDKIEGETVLERRYDVTHAAAGDRVVDSIKAFETALWSIDRRFANDLNALVGGD